MTNIKIDGKESMVWKLWDFNFFSFCKNGRFKGKKLWLILEVWIAAI